MAFQLNTLTIHYLAANKYSKTVNRDIAKVWADWKASNKLQAVLNKGTERTSLLKKPYSCLVLMVRFVQVNVFQPVVMSKEELINISSAWHQSVWKTPRKHVSSLTIPISCQNYWRAEYHIEKSEITCFTGKPHTPQKYIFSSLKRSQANIQLSWKAVSWYARLLQILFTVAPDSFSSLPLHYLGVDSSCPYLSRQMAKLHYVCRN